MTLKGKKPTKDLNPKQVLIEAIENCPTLNSVEKSLYKQNLPNVEYSGVTPMIILNTSFIWRNTEQDYKYWNKLSQHLDV